MKKNELEILKQQVLRTNEQGEVMLKLVGELESIRDEVSGMYEEFKQEFQEFKDTYPINDGEATLIKSEIYKKGYEFADEFFGKNVSRKLYHAKRIHLQMGVYTALKKHFNAIKYTTIKHIEFEETITFIRELEITRLPINYLKLTDKQIDTAEENNDDIHHHYFDKPEFRLKLM